MNIQGVRASILAFVDDGCPGWVRLEITDATSQRHSFIEKIPVVASFHLDEGSSYPVETIIHCEVIATRLTSEGQLISTIDTGQPWGLQTEEGLSTFDIVANELVSV